MSGEHILIVDDEADVRGVLRSLLMREGYVVHEARNGAELRSQLGKEPVRLITLDLNLGGEDGLALSRQARAIRDIPIIMITAKGDDVDKIVGLEVGADDYIIKPFNLREVLARIRAVLRRSDRPAGVAADEHAAEVILFGDWIMNLTTRELRNAAGGVALLTSAEFNLLEALVKRPARILSRDAILDLIKGGDVNQFDRSIDTLVARLRKKIEPNPEEPIYIKTVRGLGYVFSAETIKRPRLT